MAKTGSNAANAMLDAHVRFEADRLAGSGLDDTVREEVAALFGWLRTVRLADLAPPGHLAGVVGRLAAEAAVTEELADLLSDALAAVQGVLLEEDAAVAELLPRDAFDDLVEVLAGMADARREILDVLTTSDAYTQLVSHVLYHGVKRYVLTENLIARKIPGASALVRLGQRGLTSAAPRLEASVDRQLLAFVEANIADTLRESRRYLDTMLDEGVLTAMAAEAWEANSDRSVASVAALADTGQLRDTVRPAIHMWEHLRVTGVLQMIVGAVVQDGLERHGDRPVGDLLADLGVTEDAVTRHVVDAVRPALEQARASGFLESSIRRRLEPFYSSYRSRSAPASES